jgi:hypothetical protein
MGPPFGFSQQDSALGRLIYGYETRYPSLVCVVMSAAGGAEKPEVALLRHPCRPDTPLAPVSEEAWLTLDAQLEALGLGTDPATGTALPTNGARSETPDEPGRKTRSDR